MDRLAILAALAIVLVAVVALARLWARGRTRRVAATPAARLWEALGTAPDGRPTIVAFSGVACRECAVQAHEIDRIGKGRIRLLEIDAGHRTDIARTFGVLTVPSTVVLDAHGEVRAVNHGLAQGGTLAEQLRLAPKGA